MTDPIPAPADPAPAVPPAPAPVAPVAAAFDPESPAAKAWATAERARIAAEEGAKARTGSKENARQETLAEIAKMLGLGPKESIDPHQIAQQLAAAQAEARDLKIGAAVDRAARALRADDELVGAVLARAGKLTGLDPSADDFATKVEALVKAAVEANPRLLLTPAATPPAPAAQGPVGAFNGQPAGGPRVANLAGAIQAHYAQPR